MKTTWMLLVSLVLTLTLTLALPAVADEEETIPGETHSVDRIECELVTLKGTELVDRKIVAGALADEPIRYVVAPEKEVVISRKFQDDSFVPEVVQIAYFVMGRILAKTQTFTCEELTLSNVLHCSTNLSVFEDDLEYAFSCYPQSDDHDEDFSEDERR